MHTCPEVTVIVPHVGGSISGPCATNVLIEYLPAAIVGDSAVCVGPTDTLTEGSQTVFINNSNAVRMGDITAHGGEVVAGAMTVIIGD